MKIYGFGGQGVVTAGKILCHTYCINENKNAFVIPNYGHERRGGVVFTDVRVDEETPPNSFIYHPDVVVAFDKNLEEYHVDLMKGIHKDTILIMNSNDIREEYLKSFHACYFVDASGISLKITKKNVPNIPMLGAIAKVGLVDLKGIIESTKKLVHYSEDNINQMIGEAYDSTKKIK